MESFTIELVSDASGELFPNDTLSFLRNFLPEQVNLEGQWEVAISEISYPSMYKNITEGKFKFFDEKLSKSTSTKIENLVYTLPSQTLWKPRICSFKRETTTAKFA